MKVFFVIPNINGTHDDDVYSFGLASLASITRDKGFEYDYFIINKIGDKKNFLDMVEKNNPDVIAYTSVSSQFHYVKDISMKIKTLYGDKIIQVCGGVHVTIFPEVVIEAGGLDGIFIGEAEMAFSDFLDRVSQKIPYKDVRNFAYNNGGNLIKNDLYPLIKDLDILPFPERNKYKYEKFIKKDGYAFFMFSRGCPFLCSYCCNHALAKVYGMQINMPRYRTPDNCIKEIKQLCEKYSIKKVHVIDDTFGLDKKWVKDFCDKYSEKIRLPLMVQLRVNIVNEELMKNLKKAGCVHVNCGVESGNDYIRNKIMKRNISEKQIIDAYALFKKYGMTSNAINIIGLPEETLANIWDTIKINRKINPTSSGVNIFYPYRGTVLGDYCFDKNMVDAVAFENFDNERRSSVLKFSKEYHDSIVDIYNNWQILVCRPGSLKYWKELMRKKMPKLVSILRILLSRVRRR